MKNVTFIVILSVFLCVVTGESMMSMFEKWYVENNKEVEYARGSSEFLFRAGKYESTLA